MTITHLFFDLHGVLIDGRRMHLCYSEQLGQVLAARYGHAPEAWTEANQRIDADRDSYFADLDLGSDEGIDHMWEGLFRTTRALFRIVGASEPPHEALIALSRELPGIVTRNCDAVYPDVPAALERLAGAGLTLGVTSHAIEAQVRSSLTGGAIDDCFRGRLFGADTVGRFLKDERFYEIVALAAGIDPRACAVIDDSLHAVQGAKRIGMKAYWVCRSDRCADPPHIPAGIDAVIRDLSELSL